jgi:hypothetical protein
MAHLYAGRENLYADAATLIIDEDETTPELIAVRIAAELLKQ